MQVRDAPLLDNETRAWLTGPMTTTGSHLVRNSQHALNRNTLANQLVGAYLLMEKGDPDTCGMPLLDQAMRGAMLDALGRVGRSRDISEGTWDLARRKLMALSAVCL